jgi:hypothetical protein
MREYVFGVRGNLKALGATVSLYLHHLNRKVLWASGLALGLLIPSAAFVFWYRPAVLFVAPTVKHQAQETFSDIPDITEAPTLPLQAMSTTSASLKVNNQSIPLPSNGAVHREIHSGTTTTTVDVSTQSSSSESNSSSSSLSLDVNSHTESSDTTANPSQAP